MPDIENMNFSISSDIAKIIWDLSPIVIAMMDSEGKFLYVNNMAQHFLEYTEAELKNKTWQEITHPEDLQADINMHKLLKEKKQQQFTMHKRYITKSGRVVWGSLTVCCLNDANGNFLYFLSQIVPLDNYINNHTQNIGLEAIVAHEEEEEFNLGKFIRNNLTSLISILLVVFGGIWVFSSDLGANKQRIKGLESDIKKIERKTDESSSKIEDIMKILIQMKNNTENGK